MTYLLALALLASQSASPGTEIVVKAEISFVVGSRVSPAKPVMIVGAHSPAVAGLQEKAIFWWNKNDPAHGWVPVTGTRMADGSLRIYTGERFETNGGVAR